MKKSKNIILLSPFFFPELISTGKYNTDLAIDLSNDGHNVTVLCFHPFYPKWKIKKTRNQLKNLKIIRGGSNLVFPNNSFLRRIILEITFAFFTLRNLRKISKNIDVVIPVFPPSLAFYFIIPFINKKIKKVGIIHDLQELYSSEKGGYFNKLISFFIHKVEKKNYNFCDKLIFLSNEMKTFAINQYNLDDKKVFVSYPFISLKNNNTNQLNHLFNPKKVNIVYSGALGEKQNPEELYNFFDKASKNLNNTEYHIFSEGRIFEKLKKNNINPKINFNDLVKTEFLEELYFKSDVQIIPQKKGTSKGSLPSKLPNLMASKCKIFVITDPESEIDLIFKKYKLEKVVTTWNIENLVNSLDFLIHENIDHLNQNKVAKNLFSLSNSIDKIFT